MAHKPLTSLVGRLAEMSLASWDSAGSGIPCPEETVQKACRFYHRVSGLVMALCGVPDHRAEDGLQDSLCGSYLSNTCCVFNRLKETLRTSSVLSQVGLCLVLKAFYSLWI